jgi:hypothetical protein
MTLHSLSHADLLRECLRLRAALDRAAGDVECLVTALENSKALGEALIAVVRRANAATEVAQAIAREALGGRKR